MRTESAYYVLAWDGEGCRDDPLFTTRTIFVRHEPGVTPNNAEVVAQFEADIANYPTGLYRIYPEASVIDVTVTSAVQVHNV